MAAKSKFNLPEHLNASMVTCKFRVSYAHILEPWASDSDKTPRYSVQMIIPKSDPWVRKAKEQVKEIAIAAFGDNAVRLLKTGKLKNPFRDGDDERPDDEAYKGMVFVNANGAYEGKKPPGLYDQQLRDMRKMSNAEEYFFSGVYARAEVKFYPFDEKGGRGVACYLFRVQLLESGEPLAGGRPVEDVFDKVAADDLPDWDDDDDDDDEEETKPARRRGRAGGSGKPSRGRRSRAADEDDDDEPF